MTTATLKMTQEQASTRLKGIRDSLHDKLAKMTEDLGFELPEIDVLIDERVNGIFITDQSYPFQDPPWASMAFHPDFARTMDEEMLTTAVAEAMVRCATKTDSALRFARSIKKVANGTLPKKEAEM